MFQYAKYLCGNLFDAIAYVFVYFSYECWMEYFAPDSQRVERWWKGMNIPLYLQGRVDEVEEMDRHTDFLSSKKVDNSENISDTSKDESLKGIPERILDMKPQPFDPSFQNNGNSLKSSLNELCFNMSSNDDDYYAREIFPQSTLNSRIADTYRKSTRNIHRIELALQRIFLKYIASSSSRVEVHDHSQMQKNVFFLCDEYLTMLGELLDSFSPHGLSFSVVARADILEAFITWAEPKGSIVGDGKDGNNTIRFDEFSDWCIAMFEEAVKVTIYTDLPPSNNESTNLASPREVNYISSGEVSSQSDNWLEYDQSSSSEGLAIEWFDWDKESSCGSK